VKHEFLPQEWYLCHTCFDNTYNKVSFCLPCAQACHHDHKLEKMIETLSVCKCGTDWTMCDIQKQKNGPIQQGILDNKCTYSVTGRKPTPQFWFICRTCTPVGEGEGACPTCAKVCHAGHTLVKARYDRFYCDCGAWWKQCKIILKEK